MAHILVIDDEAPLRSLVREILEREGHTVVDAEDGDGGLRLFRERLPDLVITDIIMPGKEGIETIQELRDECPGVRILAISGGGTRGPSGPLSDARLLGADETLAKPFGIAELRDAVRRILSVP